MYTLCFILDNSYTQDSLSAYAWVYAITPIVIGLVLVPANVAAAKIVTVYEIVQADYTYVYTYIYTCIHLYAVASPPR